jgi:undecaprenyl diphosphate synthase
MTSPVPVPSPKAVAALPRHVAIIMDGNRRWAKARMLPRILGHHAGLKAVRAVVSAAHEIRLPFLTLYSFSSENWQRDAHEVSDLMGLLRRYVREDLADLHRRNVRLRFIGARDRVAPDILRLLDEAREMTRANTGLNLTIAFNYSGQDEIVAAAQALAAEAVSGRLDPAGITREALAERLQTREIPDPDLVIRTSGEKRLSNFLIWQSAYSEFVFTDLLWPEFGKAALLAALDEYARRERRFGGRGFGSSGEAV